MTKTTDQLELDAALARERLALAIRGLDAGMSPAGLVDEAVRGFAAGGAPGAGRAFATLAGWAGLKYALSRRAARRDASASPATEAAAAREARLDQEKAAREARLDQERAAREARMEEDMVEDRKPRRTASRRTRADEIADEVRDDMEGLVEEAFEQAGEAAAHARESVGEAGAWAGERLREAAEAGRRGYRDVQRFAQGNPVAVGALGLAAGVVLGVLLTRGGGGGAHAARRSRHDDDYASDGDRDGRARGR